MDMFYWFDSFKCAELFFQAKSPEQLLKLVKLPDLQEGFMNMDTLPVHQELQVRDLWTVKLLL